MRLAWLLLAAFVVVTLCVGADPLARLPPAAAVADAVVRADTDKALAWCQHLHDLPTSLSVRRDVQSAVDMAVTALESHPTMIEVVHCLVRSGHVADPDGLLLVSAARYQHLGLLRSLLALPNARTRTQVLDPRSNATVLHVASDNRRLTVDLARKSLRGDSNGARVVASTARVARKVFPPATFQRVCIAAHTVFPGTCADAQAVPGRRSPSAIPLDVVLTVANAATAVAMWALLEAGAPCVPPDEFGRTCMHYVGAAGNGVSAGMLVRRFPRMVMARDVFGRTAAQMAADRCHAVACRVLHGAPSMCDSCQVREAEVGVASGTSSDTIDSPPDAGGWAQSSVTDMAHMESCDFDSVEGLTARQFVTEYLLPGRPVILRGVAIQSPVRAALARARVAETLAGALLEVGDIPYGRAYGRASVQQTVSTFLTNMEASLVRNVSLHSAAAHPPQYMFGSIPVHGDVPLASLVDLVPPFLLHNATTTAGRAVPVATAAGARLQVFIGPAGSGAPPHVHKAAWNMVAHGAKRWLLYPPSRTPLSTQPAASWFHQLASEHEGLACTQHAGDILFVPPYWGHTTMNTATTIGVAVEFDSPLWPF